MLKSVTNIIVALSAFLFVLGCKENGDCVDRVPVVRLDGFLAGLQSGDTAALRHDFDMAEGIRALRAVIGGARDLSDAEFVDSISGTAPIKVFYPDVKNRIESLDSLEMALGVLKSNMAGLLPDVQFPKTVCAIVSPYRQSVFAVDSVLLIGLNHYLGLVYAGYADMESYSVPFKVMPYAPCEVASTLVRRAYPYVDGHDTVLLNRLLYEGAVGYAVKKLLPGVSEAYAMAIAPDRYEEVEKNESYIYGVMITNRLLYSSSALQIDRMVSPAPSTPLISPSAPGRAACYVGLRIVEAYVEKHPEVSLRELLSPAFYGTIQSFIESGYEPSER